MKPERAKDLFGFDHVETLVMTRSLADVVRMLTESERATVPPPRAQ